MIVQTARGILLAIATACFFAALQHLPMAEAISIYFAQPLILTAISALLLGEKIRQRRIITILIGLVGVESHPATKPCYLWPASVISVDDGTIDGWLCRTDPAIGWTGAPVSDAVCGGSDSVISAW